MGELDSIICKLCHHEFRYHQQTEDLKIWWCEAESDCPCDEFFPIQRGTIDDEIIVPYDSDSFRWN